MIRLAGAALVVGAAALMGEVKAGEVREQYTRLLGLQRVICSLQGEMGYARSHLGEIFARIGAQEEEPYKSWLLELSRELERRKAGPSTGSGRKALRDILKTSVFRQENWTG